MNVTLFCGGPSSEHDVSLETAHTILSHIDIKKYEVELVYVRPDMQACVLDSLDALRDIDSSTKKFGFVPLEKILDTVKQRDSLAFIAPMHGEFGEDGGFQKLLEDKGVRFTGSGSVASDLAMDKLRSAAVVVAIPGVLIPRVFTNHEEIPLPVVVKPNRLGSSIGVHVIHDKAELQKFASPSMIIQEMIRGIEVTCGCLQKRNGLFIELPPIEIIPAGSEFFDYEAKYHSEGTRYITPLEHISPELSQKISRLSCEIHAKLGCKTYSRSDFNVNGEDVYYLETNSLPGLTEHSLVPKEAAVIGMSMTDLIDFILENS